MNTLKIPITVLLTLILFTPAAFALPNFLTDATSTYPQIVGTRIDSCTLCHSAVPARNSYGDAWKAAGKNFATIEGDDSDGDGADNITEINSLTFPGDASDVPITDMTAPVITILGDNPATVIQGTPYVDAGATAEDDVDGTITGQIQTSGSVNVDVLGDYTITYRVEDVAGNPAEVTRTVTVIAATVGNTGMFDAAGGTLQITEGPLAGGTLSIPANALTALTTITVNVDVNSPAAPDGMRAHLPVTLEPSGTTFQQPVTITVPFLIVPETLVDAPSVMISYYNTGTQQWQTDGIQGVVYTEATQTLSWMMDHFSTYAVLSVEGDNDLNGNVNAVDVQLVINAVLGQDVGRVDANANGTGGIDATDIQTTINRVLGL